MADKPRKSRKRGPYGRYKYDEEIDHEIVESQWIRNQTTEIQREQKCAYQLVSISKFHSKITSRPV